MSVILFNLTTAALMVLMFKCGMALIGPDTIGRRPLPWAAVGLTALAVAAVVLQLSWSGAMAALDSDPSKSGWWRVLTATFMQNGGVSGALWNIVTLAAVAALAQWFWGGPAMVGLFLAGIVLPQHIDSLFGDSSRSTDPRNFAGSSGATYFLAATLAAGLLVRATNRSERLLALSVPLVGLALWVAQSNGHGLVSVYGLGLGLAALPLRARTARGAGRTPDGAPGEQLGQEA
ncbi:hypothetical protein ACIGXM_08950 [Kitasatospora sp. NPDC052896]|uniref:hypothetical protein n=1 Tax=Kitasatospora sp. NPDC052896 TaxID=3364061 RepID=UPI0037CB9CAD